MKVKRFFSTAFFYGAALAIATLAMLIPDGSPYRYGRIAGLWFIAQFTSAVLLASAGALGGAAVWNGIDPRQMRPRIGIIILGVIMVMVIVSLILIIADDKPVAPPTPVDIIALLVAVASTAFALFAGALAIYYCIWVLRFQKRMGAR